MGIFCLLYTRTNSGLLCKNIVSILHTEYFSSMILISNFAISIQNIRDIKDTFMSTKLPGMPKIPWAINICNNIKSKFLEIGFLIGLLSGHEIRFNTEFQLT